MLMPICARDEKGLALLSQRAKSRSASEARNSLFGAQKNNLLLVTKFISESIKTQKAGYDAGLFFEYVCLNYSIVICFFGFSLESSRFPTVKDNKPSL